MTTTEERANLKSLTIERCPECGSSSLVHDQASAEVVCTNCGFVVTTKLADRGPEWRAFTPEQHTKRARVGAPYTFAIHDKGLSTNIERRDIRGYPLKKGRNCIAFVDGRGEPASPVTWRETSPLPYQRCTELLIPLICRKTFSKQQLLCIGRPLRNA